MSESYLGLLYSTVMTSKLGLQLSKIWSIKFPIPIKFEKNLASCGVINSAQNGKEVFGRRHCSTKLK
jgi:hypothetical protein